MEARSQKQRGVDAEQLVVEFLERAGYRIRARNFSCRQGEIDIIAECGAVLAFVEVRMRSSTLWGDPSATVNFTKQRKVIFAAHAYCQRERLFARVIRFDVASVVGRGREGHVEHLIDAFDAGM